jgi:hypothetical protein
MSAATREPLRLVHAPGRRPAGARRGLQLAVVIAAVLAAVVALAVSMSSRARGLRALPAEERAALLSRTVDELRRFCGEGRPRALEEHCREQASFAAQFDECRGECETLVRPLLTPAPTR